MTYKVDPLLARCPVETEKHVLYRKQPLEDLAKDRQAGRLEHCIAQSD